MQIIGRLSQRSVVSALKLNLILALSTFGVGCGTFETLVKVPVKPSEAVVDEYQIALYQEPIHLFSGANLGSKMKQQRLMRRTENLIVLIEQGRSTEMYRGIPLDIYQREVFRRFNRTLPHIALGGGVWSVAEDSKVANFGQYKPSVIEDSLDRGESLDGIGSGNLAKAIDIAAGIASGLRGRTTLLLITPWGLLDQSAREAVMRFYQRGRSQAGFQIIPQVDAWNGSSGLNCVYAVGVGGKLPMSALRTVEDCGLSMPSDRLMQVRDMEAFVEHMLFMGPEDNDGDGVYDYKDKCPETPPDRLVDYDGCNRFVAESRR